MASRKAASGPIYAMNKFSGSRQPEGPSPQALELMHAAGLHDAAHASEDGVSDAARAPEPTLTSESTLAGSHSPHAATPPAPEREPAVAAPPEAEPARAPRPTPASPRRAKPVPAENYTLPPPGAVKSRARSNHFRLPADVEERLGELAATHGCSRTRVVCSAITSEWQRLHRRRARAAKSVKA